MKKNSWLPITMAFLGPAVLIVLVYLFAFSWNAREGATEPQVVGPELIGDVYLIVRVVDAEDKPVTDKKVFFRQRFQQGSGSTQMSPDRLEEGTTDSAGIATVGLKKYGDVVITVDGHDASATVPNLERQREIQIEVRIKL